MNRLDPAPNKIERELIEIWKHVLDLSEVGPDQPFLSLGGDSLDSMLILLQVEERLGVVLPQSGLFEHPTISKLAAEVCQRLKAGQPGALSDSRHVAA